MEGGREGGGGWRYATVIEGKGGRGSYGYANLQRIERERETADMPLLLRERERERGAIWQKPLYLK